MGASELRSALLVLGITQRRLARLLSCDNVTVNRWAQGVAPVPIAVTILLTIAMRTDLTIQAIEDLMAEA